MATSPRLVLCALALCACACAVQQQPARVPDARPAAAPSQASAAPAPASRPPQICDAGATETEVSDEILARSGRGLLWLVLPEGPDADRKNIVKRGADEVRSARALAECLLRHHDAGFDATKSQEHQALVSWLDANVGPEHAETLLAAGAAYFASLLAADSWIDAALDVPAARLFLERATAAAPQLADGLGPLILGAYECFVPKAAGGDAELGLRRLTDASARPGRLQLAMKVAAAELCAPILQDRPLFDRLLAEVDASPGVGSPFDLIAKQRAKSVRDEADQLFPDMN
jgi:hypothetical protein